MHLTLSRSARRGALVAALLSSAAGAAFAADAGVVAATAASAATPAVASPPPETAIIVTSRRREESAQAVPISLSVVTRASLERSGQYNIGLLTQQIPTVQVLSSNARNTSVTIRGLGASYGLANDGLEQGVGVYVDQVYYERPGIAVLDFVDIDQIEILRGPQGTLFGKNTTAGALNITTRAPSSTFGADVEGTYGSYNFWQGKATVTGPLAENLSGRLSFVGTRRDGVYRNVTLNKKQNDQNDLAVRGQILYTPTDKLKLRLYGDYANQDQRNCCTQAFVTAGATLKPLGQQFAALAAGIGYKPGSTNIYDRVTDTNGPLRAYQTLGGGSVIADYDLGFATVTSVSAYRHWSWLPANDRDYTSLDIVRQSANPSTQYQWSQELRLGSNGKHVVDWTAGLYYFNQNITTHGITQWGSNASYWLLPTTNSPAALLDGYTQYNNSSITTDSYAAFAEATWNITDKFRISPGVRYTQERKSGAYAQTTAGGLVTSDPTQLKNQLSISRPQAFTAGLSEGDASGRISASYDFTPDVRAYASYSSGFKSGGINMTALPLTAANTPNLASAVVKPEKVTTYDIGVKTQLFQRLLTANFAAFYTDDRDFQANVVDSGPGALRGYLANVKQVTVHGAEADLSTRSIHGFTGYANLAWSEGVYAHFANGPCPLERIGTSTTVCDLSGKALPGLSRWAAAAGVEYRRPATLGAVEGQAYASLDGSFRSSYNSDATDSKYTNIDGYGILNLRAGFKSSGPWEAYVQVKNLLDKNYIQFVSVQSGNSGLVIGNPGDARTVSVTVKAQF
ncbi:MAG TPA: TonB-dependent receptor [Caulobacteraceae bacterium]|nr:TonB-dependent receptor [Caulobacteraceae bacterium]